MIGWTIQPFDLRTFNEELNPSLGPYGQNQSIIRAQERLRKEVGEKGFLWYSTTRSIIAFSDIGKNLHEVRIDRRDLIAIINGFLWEHLIGRDRYVPSDVAIRIRRENRDRADQDWEIDRYLQKHLPEAPWSELFVQEVDPARYDQLLVRYPMDHSRIQQVRKLKDDDCHTTLPSNSTPKR